MKIREKVYDVGLRITEKGIARDIVVECRSFKRMHTAIKAIEKWAWEKGWVPCRVMWAEASSGEEEKRIDFEAYIRPVGSGVGTKKPTITKAANND